MTNQKPQNIDEYINAQPEDIKKLLENIRLILQKALPDATETISYGMPTFDLNDHHLVYFSAWKNHIGLYPLYDDGGDLKHLFSEYQKTKNSINIPFNEPFPYDVVEKFALHREKEERLKGTL